jgi:hypothetical protein
MAKKGTDLTGTACKVTAGPNKGKTGTYTTDEKGNLWCEGSWGGTECGTNKCTSKAVSNGQVFDPTDGSVTYESDGLFSNDAGEVFHVRAVLDTKSKKLTQITVVQVLPSALSSLRTAESELDRALGEAIEAHIVKHK